MVIILRKQYKKIYHKLTKKQKKIHVAHVSRLNSLPSYNKEVKQFRLWMIVLALSLIIMILAGVILTARPVSEDVVEPELHNRDIMLCLDVSGSMTNVDRSLVRVFADVVKGLDGERIGMTVFDSSASMIFPLTDDYSFLSQRLEEVGRQFDKDYLASRDYAEGGVSVYLGTFLQDGSSFIGDGLASCVTRFDNLDSKRSRSVILATDNYVGSGNQIINLKEAASLAKDRGVRVYGLNPSDWGSTSDLNAREFREAVMSTDGGYYKIDYDKHDSVSVVKDIVDKISAQEASRFKGAPQLIQTDIPQVFVWVMVAGVAVLCVISWRLGR